MGKIVGLARSQAHLGNGVDIFCGRAQHIHSLAGNQIENHITVGKEW